MEQTIYQILSYIDSLKYNMLMWFLCILWLSILQKYHYQMLRYIKRHSWKIISTFIQLIIRIGIILHEFSHIIFAFFFGAKISEIKLFDKDWWSVNFKILDYIGSLWHTEMWILFFLKLIFNRIGLFMISCWPLIIWILINSLLFYVIMKISDNYYIHIIKIIFVFLYSTLFLQSFILSFQDISNLILYRWTNIFATSIWSIINILIFLLFLLIISPYIDYLIFFITFYAFAFVIISLGFWIIYVTNELKSFFKK